MGIKNGENRTSEDRESRDIGDFESNPGILGSTSTAGRKFGHDTIGISREGSQQTNTARLRERSSNGITGEILRQLIEETERQLAYYKTQVSELDTRLQELHQLTEHLHQDEKSEIKE